MTRLPPLHGRRNWFRCTAPLDGWFSGSRKCFCGALVVVADLTMWEVSMILKSENKAQGAESKTDCIPQFPFRGHYGTHELP